MAAKEAERTWNEVERLKLAGVGDQEATDHPDDEGEQGVEAPPTAGFPSPPSKRQDQDQDQDQDQSEKTTLWKKKQKQPDIEVRLMTDPAVRQAKAAAAAEKRAENRLSQTTAAFETGKKIKDKIEKARARIEVIRVRIGVIVRVMVRVRE